MFAATPSFAQVSTYHISEGTFSDGTAFGGAFDYDPTSHQFGDYNVTTMTGTIAGITYTSANSGAYMGGGAGPNNFIFMLDDGGRYFNFTFANPLGTGTQSISPFASYECNNCSPFRRVTSGIVSTSAVASAVPEPATWAMMMFGFGAIGASLRRRHSRVAIA